MEGYEARFARTLFIGRQAVPRPKAPPASPGGGRHLQTNDPSWTSPDGDGSRGFHGKPAKLFLFSPFLLCNILILIAQSSTIGCAVSREITHSLTGRKRLSPILIGRVLRRLVRETALPSGSTKARARLAPKVLGFRAGSDWWLWEAYGAIRQTTGEEKW